MEGEKELYDLLNRIKITDDTRNGIERIRNCIKNKEYDEALRELELLRSSGKVEYVTPEEARELERRKQEKNIEEMVGEFPKALANTELEKRYIGLLLNDVKNVSVYYFTNKECHFVDEEMLSLYKVILFTDGEKYAPEVAKENFNFAKTSEELDKLKIEIKFDYEDSNYKMEKTYTELKKLFVLRKSYLGIPVKHIQQQIAGILNYELYDKMSVEEVKAAVEQVTVTEKFKRAVLNEDLTGFLVKGDNTLTNGLELPFKILSSVFKGIRQGETSSFAMPSNSGKSRFTINLAAYIALVHKKKVLLI